MPLPANLFWTHPVGDPTTVPCTHIVQQHPNGDQHTVPCTHVVQEHPGGHPNPIHGAPNLPCTHMHQAHPGGDTVVTPCVHFVPQHPGGHPGPEVPCMHPLAVVREVPAMHLKFYTSDTTIQNETIIAATRLRDLGIKIGTAVRPLCVFNRAPINGDATDPTDPFWSHYNPAFHAIQIVRGTGAINVNALRDTLHHEIGHATLGHSLVQISTPGDPHTLTNPTDPGEAMSEGWAHFVALAIRFPRTETNPSYKGMRWGQRDARVQCSPNVEYNVGCMLWDLLDTPNDGPTPNRGPDSVVLSLSEMYRVYSPTLTTIPNGPIIPNVDSYLQRLESNNPALRTRIERVRVLNCC